MSGLSSLPHHSSLSSVTILATLVGSLLLRRRVEWERSELEEEGGVLTVTDGNRDTAFHSVSPRQPLRDVDDRREDTSVRHEVRGTWGTEWKCNRFLDSWSPSLSPHVPPSPYIIHREARTVGEVTVKKNEVDQEVIRKLLNLDDHCHLTLLPAPFIHLSLMSFVPSVLRP